MCDETTCPGRRFQHRAFLLVVLVGIAAVYSCSLSAREVIVLGVFPDRALVEIDGAREVLVAGDQGSGGLRLLSTDTRRAVIWLEIDGVRKPFAAEPKIGARDSRTAKRSARLFRDSRGRYGVPGSINGQAVSLILDSGTPEIVLPQREAERLRISRDATSAVPIQTLSGVVVGHRVLLDRVQLGDLYLRSVEAWVVPGDDSRHITLGRAFLDRVSLRQENGVIILEEKH